MCLGCHSTAVLFSIPQITQSCVLVVTVQLSVVHTTDNCQLFLMVITVGVCLLITDNCQLRVLAITVQLSVFVTAGNSTVNCVCWVLTVQLSVFLRHTTDSYLLYGKQTTVL